VQYVQYKFFHLTSDRIETNEVARLALMDERQNLKSRWILADHRSAWSRTFDGFPGSGLLDALGEVNQLLALEGPNGAIRNGAIRVRS